MERDQWRAGPWAGIELLGRGGMGEVWLAEHAHRGTRVALKRVRCGADQVEDSRAFHREVAAVAALEHPNVVPILDVGDLAEADDDTGFGPGWWLAMEWAQDGSAADAPPADWPSLKGLLTAVLDALAHAHARGVVHLDLKPGNVLAAGGAHPRWLLADFGLARVLRDPDHPNRLQGTPGYMAPEQIQGEGRRVGPRTDLYALGCLGYELASGGLPFEGVDTVQVLVGHVRGVVPELVPQFPVPQGLSGWLLRLLAKSPAARFRLAADAKAALKALGPAVGTSSVSASSVRASAATFDLDGFTLDVPANTDPIAPAPTPLDPVVDWRAAPVASVSSALAPVRGRAVRLVRLRRGALVGREAERDALWDRVQGLLPARVDVTGPTGSGKTALLSWFAERAYETGAALTFYEHCAEPGWEGALLERLGDEVGPGLELHRGAVSERLASISQALRRLCEERPVVLLLDGPDPTADQLASSVARRGEGWRVLIVRAGSVAVGDQVLALEPLPRKPMAEIVGQHLDLEPALRMAIVDRAGGLPGQVADMITHLAEQDQLEVAGARLRLRDGVDMRSMDWSQLVQARGVATLARGSEAERRALLVAAAVGEDLTAEALDAAALTDALACWIGPAGPLEASAEGHLRFADARLAHALVALGREREDWPHLAERAARAATAPWRRGPLLVDAGRREEGLRLLLESAQYTGTDPMRARLAQHALRPHVDGLKPAEQVDYWRTVCVERRSAGDRGQVAAALDAATAAANASGEPALRAQIWMDRFFNEGIQQGNLERAEHCLGEALEAAGDPVPEAAASRLAECQGYLLFQRRQFAEAETWLGRALSHENRTQHDRAFLFDRLSRILERLGDLEAALAASDQAVALAADQPRMQANMLLQQSNLLVLLGRGEEGVACCRTAIAAWTRVDYPSLPLAWIFLGGNGSLAPAARLDALETALGLAQDTRQRMWALAARVEMLVPLALLGDWDRFRVQLSACEAWLELDGYNRNVAVEALGRAAILVVDRPDLAEAVGELSRRLQISR